jgi:AcrR family transcriptional regulator
MPQQRRAQLTRHAIVVAAAEEFDRAGYADTPLSAVLRRSGVTKGAFYFHFASKEAVALALVRLQEHHWIRLQRHWLGRGLDPLSTAIQLVDDAVRVFSQDVLIRAGTRLAHQRVGQAQGGQAVQPDWEGLFTGLLRRSAERGVLRGGIDPGTAARVLCSALAGAVSAAQQGQPDLPTRVTEIWRVILDGIASPEWMRTVGALRLSRQDSR